MKLDYRKIIYSKLKKAGKKPLTFKELLRSCRGKGFEFEKFTKAVDKMKKNGEIMEDKFGIRLVDPKKFVKCEVVRLNKTYGFVKNLDTDEEIFVVGKYLKGAMPHDIVLVRTFKGEGACTEGEVMSIVEENFAKFTGELVSEFGVLKIVPDMLSKYAMTFENPMRLELHEGDKVVAQVTKRGNRHSEHVCEIVSSYGSSMKASACAMSVLEVNGLTPVFPGEVIYEAREVSDYSRIKEEIPGRLDLRDKSRYSPLTAQIQKISTMQFLLNEPKQVISLAFTLPTFPTMFSLSHNWITKLSNVAQAFITQTELYQCSRKSFQMASAPLIRRRTDLRSHVFVSLTSRAISPSISLQKLLSAPV